MNAVDLLILTIVVFSGIASLRTGFLREVLGMIGLILGIVIASRFYALGASYLARAIPDPNLAKIVSFLLIWLLIWVGAVLIAGVGRQALDWMSMSWVDMFLGAAFGVARGLAIALVLLVLFMRYPIFGIPDAIRASVLGPLLLQGLDTLLQLLLGKFHLLPSAWHTVS